MLTDIKLSTAQLSKITQSGGCPGKTLGNMMDNLHKKALIDLAVPLVKDVLHKLATKVTSFRFDKFERKISGRGAIRAGKEFPLFISNEDTDIIQKVESLEKSGLLIDGATETVKHEIKKTRRWISWGYNATYGFFTDTTCGFFIDKCYIW